MTSSDAERVQGLVSAALSPLFMVLGLHVWSTHWRGGAFGLNLFKCAVASSMFLVVSWVMLEASRGAGEAGDGGERDLTHIHRDVGYILLSSLMGIVIGDNTWLQALLIIGPARVIIVDALKPGLAALFGYVFLGEALTWAMAAGIALSTGGVYLVCAHSGDMLQGGQGQEKSEGGEKGERAAEGEGAADQHAQAVPAAAHRKRMLTGYLLALANILLDVLGSVLTKRFGKTFNTFEINTLRFGFAAVCMGVAFAGAHAYVWLKAEAKADTKVAAYSEVNEAEAEAGAGAGAGEGAKAGAGEEAGAGAGAAWFRMPSMTRRAWALCTLGVCLVTFLCPALSNYALFKIRLGVCLTLTSVGPLYSLPLERLTTGRPVHRLAVLGAACAIAGVALLSLM